MGIQIHNLVFRDVFKATLITLYPYKWFRNE